MAKPPWKKDNPKKTAGKKSKKLSPTQKSKAKKAARKGGRRYPSLIDNMNAARSKRRKTGKKARKRKSAK